MSSPIEMTEMYDNALLGILQHVGNIQDFLQVYFGFLYRKTDFYRLLSGPNDRMGFPPGVAEKMVLKTFKIFEKFAIADREREAQRRAPAAIQELEVQSGQPEAGAVAAATAASASASSSRTVEASAPSQSPSSSPAVAPSPASLAASSQSQSTSVAQQSGGDQAAASTSAGATAADPANSASQSNPDSYNGAVRENYTWSQDYNDVEIKVHVEPNILKGKQVSVNFQSDRLRVALKEGSTERVLVEKGSFVTRSTRRTRSGV
ncbi:hypothetical protein AALO_G00165220 [Alosa alosa]|uniref:CS domain-containing protein n=1 Tax=Alosa alosa TaxID=278164 RepID=A0AAV6GHX8_9TELE|nr:hypothetical protein AALO_G00165220 [Alosa alosa]